MLLCGLRRHNFVVRFWAGHLTEISALKDVTFIGLRNGTVKTSTTRIELEQLEDEMRRVFPFGDWIGDRCVQLLELIESNIEGETGIRHLWTDPRASVLFSKALHLFFFLHSYNLFSCIAFTWFLFCFFIYSGPLQYFVLWVIFFIFSKVLSFAKLGEENLSSVDFVLFV